MFRNLTLVGLALVACSSGNRENSPVCGLSAMAGASMVMEQLRSSSKVLRAPPPELRGVVPARVVGYGTGRALVGESPDGVVLGFEGNGFPQVPGFGLVLVEDSADTFKGVLIFETMPPYGYPQFGSIAGANATLPLYGLRVTWGAVSDPKCPLFGPIDTTGMPMRGGATTGTG